MSKYSQDKNYIYYPDTSIPVNKLNIRNLVELEKEEQRLLLLGYKYFHTQLNEDTIFNERYYKELHRLTFIDLYDFAGEYRTFNISKGYTTFCQVRFLQQMSLEIFAKLGKDNYLRNYSDKPSKAFADKITFFMCELIALHPFFELNGRVTRLFFDLIATYNGYNYIDYQNALEIENGDNKYIAASIDSMAGNNDKMYRIILNGLNKAK